MKFFKISILVSLLTISACNKDYIKETEDKSTTQIYKIDTGIANVYLLKGRKNILVDTSEDGKRDTILKSLKELNVNPEELTLIILTHGHGDHSGGAKYFQEHYKIPILAGKGDLKMLSNGKNDPLKPTSNFSALLKGFINDKFSPIKPDISLENELNLEEYGIEGKAVILSGHTEGSTIIYLNNEKDIIVGDLIRGGIFSTKEPDEHFFHNDREKVKENIKNLVKNEKIENFFTGHFGPLKAKDVKSFIETLK